MSGAPADSSGWKELFEWSIRAQVDSGSSQSQASRPLPEAERKWLEAVLKSGIADLTNQMQNIKTELDGTTQGENTEQLLDELLEVVENIDQARDLTTIGGLDSLRSLLSSPVAGVRWRSAEVIATCAQNHPEVQQHFTDASILPDLWPLLDDADTMCQIKGLLAYSCMIRGHPPALSWFLANTGIEKLIELLTHDNVKVQRKCLQLLEYIATQTPRDLSSVSVILRPALAGVSDDAEVQQLASNLDAILNAPS